jgi:hypothetical protein
MLLRYQTLPVTLRSLLNDRASLEDRATKVVKLLLSSQQMMFKKNISLRQIQPSAVSFSEDLGDMVYGDLSRVMFDSFDDDLRGQMPAPYEASHYGENAWMADNGPFCDRWSTGVVLLEILAGSKFVMNLASFEEIEAVFSGIKRVLDPDTAALLKSFLFLGEAIDMDRYIEKTLVEEPDLIGEAMRRARVTIESDKILSDLRVKARLRAGNSRDKVQPQIEMEKK